MIGWHTVRFDRMEKPKTLDDYLKPAPTLMDKRAEGAAKVRAMLERRVRQSGAGAPIAN